MQVQKAKCLLSCSAVQSSWITLISLSLCSLKMPENSMKWLSLSKHGRKNKVNAAFIMCSCNLWGYVTGWSWDSQGANVQAAYHWPFPMPRSWERCRERNWQDLWRRSSAVCWNGLLKMEALNQLCRRKCLGGECTWKCDLSHRTEVWLFWNHRTIPGSIRRAIEVTHA